MFLSNVFLAGDLSPFVNVLKVIWNRTPYSPYELVLPSTTKFKTTFPCIRSLMSLTAIFKSFAFCSTWLMDHYVVELQPTSMQYCEKWPLLSPMHWLYLKAITQKRCIGAYYFIHNDHKPYDHERSHREANPPGDFPSALEAIRSFSTSLPDSENLSFTVSLQWRSLGGLEITKK